VRVVIRFVEKPFPYYSLRGKGWADVASTAEEAVATAALRVGMDGEDDVRLRISWEDVPDNFIAPELTFIDLPEDEGYLN
jgi:hypothetical protein